MKFLLKDLRAVFVGLIVGIGIVIMSYKFGYQELIVIFSIFVFLYLFAVIIYQVRSRNPASKDLSQDNNLQTLFGKIANLYTQTGLLIQDSFNAPVEVIGGKSRSLHKDFKNFTECMNTITLSVPQETGVKIMSFFDLLFDYKKQADVLINSLKTNENYDRWLDLKQRYEQIVAPRYTELETYLRNVSKGANHT